VRRWSEPGGEYESGILDDYWLGAGGLNASYHHLQIGAAAQRWVRDRSANHGVVLRRIGGEPNLFTFNSGELETGQPWTRGDGRPYLNIQYTLRSGMRRGWQHESWQVSDRIAMRVNVATGNLMVQQRDFSMPGGLGPDVAVTRTYNSFDRNARALGTSWVLSPGQDVHLEPWANEHVDFHDETGARYRFDGIYDRLGEFRTPPGLNATLVRNRGVPDSSPERFTLTEHQTQTRRFFSGSGRLTAIEDRNGRRTTMSYTNGDRIASVTDSQGDAVSFTHASPTQLTSFTDPANRQHAFGYTGTNLTSYTDPASGTTAYEYDPGCDKLSKLTTPAGRQIRIAYYASGENQCRVHTVTRVTDSAAQTGPTWTFEYRLRPDGSGETRVIDPIGTASTEDRDRMTRYDFDEDSRVTRTRDALGRVSSVRLTSNSRVQSYTAAGNRGSTPNTTFRYDEGTESEPGTDNLLGTTTPTGDTTPAMTTNTSYGQGITAGTAGAQYLPTEHTDATGFRTDINYGSGTTGNVHQITQRRADNSAASQVSIDYISPGQVGGVTDGRGNRTAYSYTDGNITGIDPPGTGIGATAITHHASLDRVETVRDGRQNYRLLSYDNLDRLIKIEFTGGDQTLDATDGYVAYTYDRDGNQLTEQTREEGTGTVRTRTMTYDTQGRVTHESLPGGGSNAYTYDDVGNLTSLTDGGGQVEYAYNDANEQTAVYEPGVARPTRFAYNQDGQRQQTRYPNGVVIDQAYDQAQRLTEIHAQRTGSGAGTLQRFRYSYANPSTGRQTPLRSQVIDDVLGHTTRYGYDALDRLEVATTRAGTGEAFDGSLLREYAYTLDEAGNITNRTTAGSEIGTSSTTAAFNEANQLCWRSTSGATPPADACTTGAQFSYDANGNETSTPLGRSAAYNTLDQTTSFTIGGSPTSLVYLGAGQDRWISEGGTSFQHNVLGLGSRGSTYWTRDESGGPVSRRSGTTRHYFLFDALGSITGLTDATGALAERHDYEPYGTDASGMPAGQNIGSVAHGQLGFAGGYRSVGGLYHFGQRYLDPALGRWTQPDPIDQTGDLRQGNAYLYAAADPVSLTDPDGTLVPALAAIGVSTVVRFAGGRIAYGVGRRLAYNAGGRYVGGSIARNSHPGQWGSSLWRSGGFFNRGSNRIGASHYGGRYNVAIRTDRSDEHLQLYP